MCLPIDCWLCMPRTVDDDLAPASRTQHPQHNRGGHYTGNGAHHQYNGNGYTAHRPAAAEADRKASNDARRGPAVQAAATGAQEKAAAAAYPYAAGANGTLKQQPVAAYTYAGADGTLKQQQPAAASNGRVAAADGGHGARGGAPHNYYERAQQQPAHREDAADSHYYPAATVTADHERY